MEWAVGEREEPLRPDDETSFPYCAAQRNLDNIGIRSARGAPGSGGNPAGDRAPEGAKGARTLRYPRGECRGLKPEL